jgi:hypothetical protein
LLLFIDSSGFSYRLPILKRLSLQNNADPGSKQNITNLIANCQRQQLKLTEVFPAEIEEQPPPAICPVKSPEFSSAFKGKLTTKGVEMARSIGGICASGTPSRRLIDM